jgi:hypothetical protein
LEAVEGQRPRPKGRHLQETSAAPRGGFTLESDPAAPIVHMRFWGFWDLEIAKRLRSEVLALGRPPGGGTWSALVDSRTFLPQSPEVSQHRRETMVMIMNEGCRRIAAIVAENGTYAMQFTRIATEAGVMNRVFLDPDDALKWIRET